MKTLAVEPLTAEAFAAYGEVIEINGPPDKMINAGMCGRHHDLARLEFSNNGRAGISLFDAQARTLPYRIDMVERHPDGSQAFIPLDGVPFLVSVADNDEKGNPTGLKAFITSPGQSINLHRGVWHGVLAPINKPGRYAVVDRIGDGPNLEEYYFDEEIIVKSLT